MNAASGVAQTTATTSATALYAPAVAQNGRILSSLATLASCFSGLIAGILGLTNWSGFGLFLVSSLLSAVTVGTIKCGMNITKYVPQGQGAGLSSKTRRKAVTSDAWRAWWALTGMGQENLLGFLLFWIGSYALIHVYD